MGLRGVRVFAGSCRGRAGRALYPARVFTMRARRGVVKGFCALTPPPAPLSRGARGSGVRTGFYCVLLVMAIYASIRCACTPFGARCAVTRRSHEGTEVSGVRLGRRGVRRARSARWDFALSFSTRKKKAPKKNALSIGRRKTRPPVASPTLAHPVRHRGAALTRRAA